jgi:hypothetical protein
VRGGKIIFDIKNEYAILSNLALMATLLNTFDLSNHFNSNGNTRLANVS